MPLKPGVLAYIAVPADWPGKKLDGKVVEVLWLLTPHPGPGKDKRPTWQCKFRTPWYHNQKPIHECGILESWLRPISGVPLTEKIAHEVKA